MQQIAVIGDSHGCFLTVKALINKLPKDVRIIFVGDVIDRGPRSRELLDYIIANEYECVLGNHEEFMLLTQVSETEIFMNQYWEHSGGLQTIKSYEKDIELFKIHKQFLKNLPLFIHIEIEGFKDLVVSHSLIQHVWKGKDFNYIGNYADSIIWDHISRDYGLTFNREVDTKEFDTDIFNIIGHSIIKDRPLITESVAAIDSGCFLKEEDSSFGTLTAILYPSLEIIQQKNID